MKYLLTGYTIINNVRYTDGRSIDNILGGNGIFCLAGLRLFDKDCGLLAAVGEDFEQYYGEWYDKNSITRATNIIRDPHTMNSVLTYFPNGDYTDVSIWGGDTVFHSDNFFLNDSDLEAHLEGVKGLYLYSRWKREFPKAFELQKKYGYKIMWEVTTGIDPSYRVEFDDYVQKCDIFSLNYSESRVIFGTDDLPTLIKEIRATGKPCYYRLGTDGAMMVTKDECTFVPMLSVVPKDQEVDATGCGNSSTAAAFWAWCEGKDTLMTNIIGNVAAAYNVAQYGPCPDMNDDFMKEAMDFAEKTYNRLKNIEGTYIK